MKSLIVDKKTGAGVFSAPYADDLSEQLRYPEHVAWIDFFRPDYGWLKKEFGVPSCLLDLCKLRTGVPCIVADGKYTLFKTMVINSLEETSCRSEITFIFSRKVLLTLHEAPVKAFSGLEAESDKVSSILRESPASLFFYLLSLIMEDYLRCAERWRALLDVSDAEERTTVSWSSAHRSVSELYASGSELKRILKRMGSDSSLMKRSRSRSAYERCVYMASSLLVVLYGVRQSLAYETAVARDTNIRRVMGEVLRMRVALCVTAVFLCAGVSIAAFSWFPILPAVMFTSGSAAALIISVYFLHKKRGTP
ncbi:MAG: magnesium transporter CorA family protein [Candidatus Auribacter fodinae]|jgi:Mg2+ and Co2+ transporter CorA|uniref:Magnesium transporter CorA family protein n=1 Tax=Candidatus Auribacter fodinae TaxID=2093366 RepID=A0A3A4QWD8_9BACT|nr:MAG: magnesium transporter CorA family protein [Candidatus Auribacter fodinae]